VSDADLADPVADPVAVADLEPGHWRAARRHRLRRVLRAKPLAAVAGGWLALFVLVATFAPLVAPHDPNKPDVLAAYKGPSRHHWLGTDDIGRDQLSRLVFGARTSVLAALEAIAISTVLGLTLGLLAGFFGGFLDSALGRINDALMSVPNLILALAVVAVLGPGLANAMLAIGIVFTPRTFRIMRATASEVRHQTFIEAAAVIGCKRSRVLLHHVLPNSLSPLVVLLSVSFGTAVLAESGLSFLGLGARPPAASWGGMLAAASRRLDLKYLLFAPGVALVLTVLACTVFADALNEALGGSDG
jgi:peptide/nickel transport system permease protein